MEPKKTRAQQFVDDFHHFRTDLGVRQINQHLCASRFAEDAIEWHGRARGVRALEHHQHAPFGSQVARQQVHAVFRFSDGSANAVYNGRITSLRSSDDAVYLNTSRGRQFIGGWDGADVSDLWATVEGFLTRSGMDAISLAPKMFGHLTLTRSHGAPSAHPMNGVAEAKVVAVDATSQVLVIHEGLLDRVPWTVAEIQRERGANCQLGQELETIGVTERSNVARRERLLSKALDRLVRHNAEHVGDRDQSVSDDPGMRMALA